MWDKRRRNSISEMSILKINEHIKNIKLYSSRHSVITERILQHNFDWKISFAFMVYSVTIKIGLAVMNVTDSKFFLLYICNRLLLTYHI